MPAETRPTSQNVVTLENFALGMPIVEFAPLSGGVLQPYLPLGVVDSAALAKELETLEMEDGSPGLRATILEIITKVSPSFAVGVFNFSADIMRFAMGGATLTSVTANPTQAVTDEKVTTTTDPLDFLFLKFPNINAAGVVVTPALNSLEAVGTGDGTLGDTSGEYFLKYKVNAVADVASLTVGGVAYAPIAVGTAAAGLQVEVVVGTGATSGNLQFFNAGVAVNVTGAIVATYTPSFALTEGIVAPDDYTVARKEGRIRVIHEATKATGTQPIIAGQAVFVDYTYNKKAHTTFQPFTQNSFTGAARIKLLSDQGVNLVWNIPSAQIAVSDEDLAFDDEGFMIANITLSVLDAGGTDRFGTIQHFTKTQAGNV